jgi:hypothetical protein
MIRPASLTPSRPSSPPPPLSPRDDPRLHHSYSFAFTLSGRLYSRLVPASLSGNSRHVALTCHLVNSRGEIDESARRWQLDASVFFFQRLHVYAGIRPYFLTIDRATRLINRRWLISCERFLPPPPLTLRRAKPDPNSLQPVNPRLHSTRCFYKCFCFVLSCR